MVHATVKNLDSDKMSVDNSWKSHFMSQVDIYQNLHVIVYQSLAAVAHELPYKWAPKREGIGGKGKPESLFDN